MSDVKNGYFGNKNAQKLTGKHDVFIQMRVKREDKLRWQKKAKESEFKTLSKWIINKIETGDDGVKRDESV